MGKLARLSGSSECKIHNIQRPFSNFDFIEENFPYIKETYIETAPIRRLFSQVRQHDGKTLIFENVDDADDLKEENIEISKQQPDFIESHSFRLGFFKKSIIKYEEISLLESDDFIGYAIIKINKFKSGYAMPKIYESVIWKSRHENNCIRGSSFLKCLIGNKTFDINGYLYSQQNGISNVCAHVALRTVISRFHPDGDILYKEMNEIIGLDLKSDEIRGLNKDEMIKILNDSGASARAGPAGDLRERGRVGGAGRKHVHTRPELG